MARGPPFKGTENGNPPDRDPDGTNPLPPAPLPSDGGVSPPHPVGEYGCG